MKKSLFALFLGLAALPANAAVLTQAPSPMTQTSGPLLGMVHINVGWDALSSTLTVHPDGSPVDLKPLSLWQPGNSFHPDSPWFSTLDPSQGAGLFNSQYGLHADSASLPVDLLGSRFLVNVVSATVGLDIYRSTYMGATQTFEPILGTNGADATLQWTGTMMHPMFVMPAGSSGTASVTLRFTITDSSYTPLAGHAPVETTVGFTAVPEPSMAALAAIGGMSIGLRRRRTAA